MIGRALGEGLANSGLADHQKTMVGAGQFARDASRVGIEESIMRNLDVQDPQVRALLENALPDGEGIMSSIISNFAGAGFGQAFNFIAGAEDVLSGHRNAIMQADANGMPGFTYTTFEVGGVTYKAWIDASPEAIGERIDSYTQPSTPMSERHEEAYEAHMAALEAQAIGEVHSHLAAGNSPEEYIGDIEHLMERIIETLIEREYEQHSSLDAGTGNDHDNTMPPAAPPPPGPTGFA